MTIKTVELSREPREPVASPTCPLCHTADRTITNEAVAAGGSWRCTRCGQMWSAQRLATAAAYARTQVAVATPVM